MKFCWKPAGLFLLLFLFSIVASAQNTKGDNPRSNQKQVRESKFKTKTQKKKPRTKDLAGRRLRTKDKSSANRANASYPQPDPYANRKQVKGDRSAKTQNRVFSSPPRERHRAWRGDLSGSPIRKVRPTGADAARNNVYPQRGPYINNPSRKPQQKSKVYTRTASGAYPQRRIPSEKQRAWKGDARGNPVGSPRSASGRTKNVYKQFGKFEHNPSRKPRKTENLHYGKSGQASFINFSSPPKPRGRSKGTPASASRPFVKKGKKNVYWGKYSKGEKANTRDITGGPLRTRNFRSSPAGLVGRDTLKHFGKKPIVDQAPKGKHKGGGGFSATRRGQRAWTGDISGSKLRRTNPRTKETAGKYFYPRKLSVSKSGEAGRQLPGGGFTSRTRKSRFEKDPVPSRAPGIGASTINKYNSSLKGRKTFKGGGSVARSGWNNDGNPINVRGGGDGSARAARYQGSFKRGELAPGFSPQGIGYAGNIKTRRPPKGGGSVSGQLWNNNNQPVDVNDAGKGTVRASKYKGSFKRGELTPGFTPQGIGFAGNIKTRRPAKGGGSVSGKLWNNNEQPVDVVEAGRGAERASKFQGTLKSGRPAKGGGSVSGELWNNNEQPIQRENPSLKDAQMARFTYKERKPLFRKMFIQNPNADKEAIKKAKPDDNTYKVGGLQVRVKQKNYEKKPNAAKGSMPGIAPKAGSLKAVEYSRAMKRTWDYKHNPNSADEALDVREPGKANARIGDFQGNVKMHKPHGNQLHPDAKFAHSFNDNVKDERSLLTNFKLFWAKLFKKSENQPDHLKEKNRRPRYDKREQGLWYN